jgi:hypothetical protein
VTAYLGSTQVGSNTAQSDPGLTYPVGTLTFGAAQGFENVVVHWLLPPSPAENYAPVFLGDDVRVTTLAAAVPEPTSLTLLALAVALTIAGARLRRRLARA